MMKKLLLMLLVIDATYISAQKSIGFFGKQNSIGISTSINPVNLSEYDHGRILIPTIQYTRVKNRMRSFVFEYGRFSMKLKPLPNYVYYIKSGNGTITGTAYGLYSVKNWRSMGQLGSYHSWGVHMTHLSYDKNDIQYQYVDTDDKWRDTTLDNSKGYSTIHLAVSFSLGKKRTLGKSERLVLDYGLRLRIPLTRIIRGGNDATNPHRGSEIIEGTIAYANSTMLMLYAGLHYAF
jgi:hypothetical protein